MAADGKEGAEFMERVVYASLGGPSKKVKVGPGRGLDNAVVSIGNGRVMILTVDPVSVIPAFGMRLSARLSVHLVASDLTASGVDPEFAVFSYNFPPAMAPSEKEEYVGAVGKECARLGVAIAAGHTGTYPGGGYTIVGSGTMIGLATERGYVTPSMARAGDAILMTKHAGIEATGALALSFPGFLEQKVGGRLARRAKSMLKLCSTVEDARGARRVGLGRDGVTSMHDATEGGVLGALDEMAGASKKSFEVEVGRIPIMPEAAAVCAAFGLDPLRTMGEGALLVTCAPWKARGVERAVSRSGIAIQEIGVVKEGTGLVTKDRAGRRRRPRAGQDGYWPAYEKAVSLGLR